LEGYNIYVIGLKYNFTKNRFMTKSSDAICDLFNDATYTCISITSVTPSQTSGRVVRFHNSGALSKLNPVSVVLEGFRHHFVAKVNTRHNTYC